MFVASGECPLFVRRSRKPSHEGPRLGSSAAVACFNSFQHQHRLQRAFLALPQPVGDVVDDNMLSHYRFLLDLYVRVRPVDSFRDFVRIIASIFMQNDALRRIGNIAVFPQLHANETAYGPAMLIDGVRDALSFNPALIHLVGFLINFYTSVFLTGSISEIGADSHYVWYHRDPYHSSTVVRYGLLHASHCYNDTCYKCAYDPRHPWGVDVCVNCDYRR